MRGASPDLQEALNAAFWAEVAERIAELPPDQAEDHLAALIELLGGDEAD